MTNNIVKIVVERNGASVYGNPRYNVIDIIGNESEIEKAFLMGIVRNYKKGVELVRNSSHVYTVNNQPKTITQGRRKKMELTFQIIDKWHNV